MNISTEIVAVIGTIVGTLVGSLSTFFITWLNTKSEERKHFRELVMKIAIEEWKMTFEIARATNQPVKIYPLETYNLPLFKFSELVFDKKLDPSKIEKILDESFEVRDRVLKHKRYQQ